ncbi:hypothetical protein B5J94_12720, partial [Moraxella lacunata]
FGKGSIDKTGTVVIPIGYDDAWDFSEGLAWVIQHGNLNSINKNGKVVISTDYGRTNSFSEGLAGVASDKTWGFIDK